MAIAEYDLVVLGGGPGGYVAAIRAAQLGLNVACIDENDKFGGTCLRVGCIPSKALLESSHLYHDTKSSLSSHGIQVSQVQLDLAAMMKRKDQIVQTLTGGIDLLFKKNKVDYLKCTASIPAAGKVEVTAADGTKATHDAANILITTGAKSRPMPGFPFNGTTVIGSKEAMTLEKQPKSVIVIGAGAIGIEFAYFFNAYGTKVTVVEMLPNILPVEDTEVSQTLEKSLSTAGIRTLPNTTVTGTPWARQTFQITV